MKIYNNFIQNCLDLLHGQHGCLLKTSEDVEPWPDAGDNNLVLRSEMAYELGGGNLPAVTGVGCTSSQALVDCDSIWLYGPDLNEIQGDTPYARLTFLRVADESLGQGNNAYTAIRKIEYARYHIKPKGYMSRISTISNREPVRISRKALEEGLSFEKVGGLFLREYHKNPKIIAALLIFITIPDFPYHELNKKIIQGDQITESLDHIFKNLKMDCTTCNLKEICDEVEGMRELHFSQNK